MSRGVLLVIALLVAPFGAASQSNDQDLTQAQYDDINAALTQGDEAALPHCPANSCPADITHLLEAAALRIRWNLPGSLKESQLCAGPSESHHDFTRYSCARLANSNADNLYGYYGYWSTIGALAEAIRQGYSDHAWEKLWHASGSAASNPVIKLAHSLESYHFKPEGIIYTGVTSAALLGNGAAKVYTDDGTGRPKIKSVVNYPSVHVKINGYDAVMLIDSGTQSTTLYAAAAKRLGVTTLNGLVSESTGVTGGHYNEKIGIAESLQFPGITLRDKVVRIDSGDIYAAEDGLIGLDILDKLPAFMMTKDTFLVNPKLPTRCKHHFTVSSDWYGVVHGIAAADTEFDGLPAVAVLDTGNAAAAIAPTWGMVKRARLPVIEPVRTLSAGGGGLHELNSGRINGKLEYLGHTSSGQMAIGTHYPNSLVDFNIGMPYFYGNKLYVSFKDMKVCIFRK